MGNTDLTLQLDVTNLTDKRHVATAGSTDFVESDATGTRQTLQNGAPRQLFVTLRARL
jgi:iron complex outermembrane receptor protein